MSARRVRRHEQHISQARALELQRQQQRHPPPQQVHFTGSHRPNRRHNNNNNNFVQHKKHGHTSNGSKSRRRQQQPNLVYVPDPHEPRQYLDQNKQSKSTWQAQDSDPLLANILEELRVQRQLLRDLPSVIVNQELQNMHDGLENNETYDDSRVDADIRAANMESKTSSSHPASAWQNKHESDTSTITSTMGNNTTITRGASTSTSIDNGTLAPGHNRRWLEKLLRKVSMGTYVTR